MAAKSGVARAALRLNFFLPLGHQFLRHQLDGIPRYPGAFLPVGPSVSISQNPYLKMEGWWLDQQQDWPVRTAYLRALSPLSPRLSPAVRAPLGAHLGAGRGERGSFQTGLTRTPSSVPAAGTPETGRSDADRAARKLIPRDCGRGTTATCPHSHPRGREGSGRALGPRRSASRRYKRPLQPHAEPAPRRCPRVHTRLERSAAQRSPGSPPACVGRPGPRGAPWALPTRRPRRCGSSRARPAVSSTRWRGTLAGGRGPSPACPRFAPPRCVTLG